MALKSVLFVCTGNTCRSPMAAALLKHYAEQAGIPVEVSSAGLGAFTGDPATEYAVEVMSEIGLDLKSHRSRKFRAELAEEYDLILVMTNSHRQYVVEFFPEIADKVHLLLEFSQDQQSRQELDSEKEKGLEVSDPFGQSRDVYRQVRDELAQAVQAIVESWINEEEEQ